VRAEPRVFRKRQRTEVVEGGTAAELGVYVLKRLVGPGGYDTYRQV
jgi:hypothetical protein